MQAYDNWNVLIISRKEMVIILPKLVIGKLWDFYVLPLTSYFGVPQVTRVATPRAIHYHPTWK